MYAVIFKAEINQLDNNYYEMAAKIRDLAKNKYGCTDFYSISDSSSELAISYWETQEQISNWKQDAEHLVAQELGRTNWYKSYSVEIVEIIREYKSDF